MGRYTDSNLLQLLLRLHLKEQLEHPQFPLLYVTAYNDEAIGIYCGDTQWY